MTSTNWSGYAVNTSAGAVTAVSGSWTVPTVTGAAGTYSSTWVGIDGYSSNSVEQTGIEADVNNSGVPTYSAWYEMYPAGEVTIPGLAIHANDQITASVTYASGKFTMTITDLSDSGNNSFSVTKSGSNLQRSSAEWIEEAPSSYSGVLPLANFGTATFTNASTTINGTTGAINNSAWANNVYSINMTNSSGTVIASTSSLDPTGTSFSVAYIGVSPPPPQSPPPPPPQSPPPPPPPTTPGGIITTTTLVGVVDKSPIPEVTFIAEVSPSVPLGSYVELFVNGSELAVGRVKNIGGVDEAVFNVEFFAAGTYTFVAEYLGSGSYDPSMSNSLTVNVTNQSTMHHSTAILTSHSDVMTSGRHHHPK